MGYYTVEVQKVKKQKRSGQIALVKDVHNKEGQFVVTFKGKVLRDFKKLKDFDRIRIKTSQKGGFAKDGNYHNTIIANSVRAA